VIGKFRPLCIAAGRSPRKRPFNARLPDHEHVLIEQTYLLEGSLVRGEGTLTPGNFV
jgi:anti-sigma factor ChrR (cupin superfamily)